jgi:hypothetical protein
VVVTKEEHPAATTTISLKTISNPKTNTGIKLSALPNLSAPNCKQKYGHKFYHHHPSEALKGA